MNHTVANKNALSGIAVKFLVTTFCIMLLCWGGILLINCFWDLRYGTPFFMVLYMLGGFSPTISAVFWVLKDKILPWKQILQTVFSFKQKFWLYITVFCFAGLSFAVPLMMGHAHITGPLYMPLLLLPLMLFGGGLEEVGWRWVLQPALEKKMPFVPATMLTAAIWAVWHLPLFLIEGVPQYTMPYGSFVIMVFGLAFALAAVYRVSHSVWLCVVLHSLINALNGTIVPDQTIVATAVTAAVVIAVSLLTVMIQKHTVIKRSLRMGKQ